MADWRLPDPEARVSPGSPHHADTIGTWSQAELRRFVVNLLLTDPGALPKNIGGAQQTLPTAADGNVPVWDAAKNQWVSSADKKVTYGNLDTEWHVAEGTSGLTLSTSAQDVPGATTTTTDAGVYLIIGHWDFSVTTGAATLVLVGELIIGGATQGQQALEAAVTSGERVTASQAYLLSVEAGVVIKMSARKNAATGACALIGGSPSHTTLRVAKIAST